jgi:hypothetical protein
MAACGDAGSAATAATSPAAAYTSDDLSNILVSEDTAPEGKSVEPGDVGRAALILPLPPSGPAIDDGAFVDARTTRIGHTMTGGYTSWAALFETAADAQEAFEFLASQHEADEGWGLNAMEPDADLAEDSVWYTGAYGPWDSAGIYFWRESNLLLAAIGVGDYDPEVLLSIAEGMDGRTR